MFNECSFLLLSAFFCYPSRSFSFVSLVVSFSQGAERSMDLLHKHLQLATQPKTVFFLTACHQLPFYSFIHDPNVRMGFLDCSPQLDSRGARSWRERFWTDPIGILDEIFVPADQKCPASSGVYIEPFQQRETRTPLWFGNLHTSYSTLWAVCRNERPTLGNLHSHEITSICVVAV